MVREDESESLTPLRGRLVACEPGPEGCLATVRTEKGIQRVQLSTRVEVDVLGSIGEVRGGRWQVLTPNRLPGGKTPFTDRVLDPRRLRALRVREQVERGIRDFFRYRGFREVRTPLLVPCPGMEPHIRPIRAGGAYLPTSPEFAMKRLLVGGLERVFQICPAFRDEPLSRTHHPEFTMLEWYRAYAGYKHIMDDAEELIADLCKRVHGGFKAQMGDHVVDFARPWPRFTVRELFQKHVGVDLGRGCDRERLAAACRERGHVAGEGEDWDDLFFKLWLNHVEPALPSDRPVIVHRYPPSQAALAVVEKDGDGTHWARRFEVYAGGLELANAFEELTDPVEQRARFEKDMALRERVYDDFEPSPLDEGFLQALGEGMPPSGGIALGVDRLVMLLAGEPDIDFTLWLKSASEESRSQSPGP